MDWLNLADMAIKAGGYIFSELNSNKSGSAEQIRLQHLRQAEDEKEKGLNFYCQNQWEDAIHCFETAKRLNPNIKEIDYVLSQARNRLAIKKRILFFVRLLFAISIIYGVYYLLKLQ